MVGSARERGNECGVAVQSNLLNLKSSLMNPEVQPSSKAGY